MKVYTVQNGDDVIMGIFRKQKKARRFAKDIGRKRWNEEWSVTPVKLDQCIDVSMLLGCEAFRASRKGQEVAREIIGTHT